MVSSTYRVVITANSPLHFSQRKPGGIFQESLPYVPGSALRGTVARLFLKNVEQEHIQEEHRPGQAGRKFDQLFLSDKAAIFTNAYPTATPDQYPRPLPATAVSCKNDSGFLTGEEEPHGVFDTLIDRLGCETLEPAGLVYSPDCPECRGRIESFPAIFTRQNGNYYRGKVSQRLLTRVAINRRRAVAEGGMLYSPWVIEEVRDEDKQPAQFVAYLYQADEGLAKLVESVTAIGGGSSRGLNHVQVETQVIQPETSQAIEKRVEALNKEIDRLWTTYQALGGNGKQKQGTYFTVDLQSDAILRCPDGRPTMVLEAEMLNRAAGDKLASVSLARSYATYHYAGGWNSAWNLPKPASVCTRQGSVYLFCAANGLGPEQYQALAELQQSGLGERTPEGFGQLRICDEFHLVGRNNRK